MFVTNTKHNQILFAKSVAVHFQIGPTKRDADTHS